MGRYRITLTPTEEDGVGLYELREFAYHKRFVEHIADALAAALPSLIDLKPGMVLRNRHNGVEVHVLSYYDRTPRPMRPDTGDDCRPGDRYDSKNWEVVYTPEPRP